MNATTTLARAMSIVVGAGLIAVGAYLNVHDIGTRQGYLSPDCLTVYGIAGGTAGSALVIIWLWDNRRVTLALVVLAGVVAGEAFGFYVTAERLLFARSERVAQMTTANAPRLTADEAVKRAIADLDAAKAEAAKARSDKRCGDVCRAWEAKEVEARERLGALEQTRLATSTLRDPTPLATALGVSPVVADIVPALLGSAALLILGFGLIAAGGHAPAKRSTETTPDPVEARMAPKDRREANLAMIREMTKRNGGEVPPFHVIRNELRLPNATASRYRRKAIGL